MAGKSYIAVRGRMPVRPDFPLGVVGLGALLVSGAGYSGVNGTYEEYGPGADGSTVYRHADGSWYVFFHEGGWSIGVFGVVWLYRNDPDEGHPVGPDAVPYDGWTLIDGTNPCPTVTTL